MPFFTIAVPTRNRAHLLPQVLAGILNQSFTDFELLVADDASEDDTRDVVAGFADSRIRYIRHTTRLGTIKNWGYCAQHARGDWLVFHPDEDLLSPLFLDRCAKAVLTHPEIVMYAADVAVKVDGEVDRLFGDRLLPLPHRWDLPQPRILPGLEIAALSMFRMGFLPPALATPAALYRKHWRGDSAINARILCEGNVAYESYIGAIIRSHPHVVGNAVNDLSLAYFEEKQLDWRGALETICAEIPHGDLQTWLAENSEEPAVCEAALDVLHHELARRADPNPPTPDVAEVQQLWRLGLKYQALKNEFEDYRSERRHRIADKIARVCGWD